MYIESVRLLILWTTNLILSLKVLLSHNAAIVTHNITLSCPVTLSCLAPFRVSAVTSLRASGGYRLSPQPLPEYLPEFFFLGHGIS